MTSVNELRAWMDTQNELVGRARQEFEALWAKLLAQPGVTPGQIRDTLLLVYPALIDKYSSISAALAAELYDTLRAQALGSNGPRYTALAQTGYSRERLEEAINKAARYLESEMPDKMRESLTFQTDIYVKQAGRNTMLQSAQRDPAKPRFARVPMGDSCAFCVMLASGGWRYRVDKDRWWRHEQIPSGLRLHDSPRLARENKHRRI